MDGPGRAAPPSDGGGDLRDLQPGETLFREGQSGDAVFEVVSGTLAVLRGDPAIQLDVVGPGAVVGEIAALAGTSRTASLRALEPATVRRLAAAELTPDRLAALGELARGRILRHRAIELVTGLLGVDPDQAAEVTALASWVQLGAGEELFHEGADSDAAYLVVSGRLAVDRDGHALGEVGRGELVGEIGLVGQAARSATVTALRDTSLARFEADIFERLASVHPQLMLQVARTVIARAASDGPRVARAHAIAVAVVPAADQPALLDQMAAELSRHGTTARLSAGRVNTDLGRPGVAADDSPAAAPAVADYLNRAESEHDYLLLETGPPSPDGVDLWTRRALAAADRIVLVLPAQPTPDEVRLAEQLLAAVPQRHRVGRWLALRQPPEVTQPTGSGALADQLGCDRVIQLRHGSAAGVARLARVVSGTATGLVLGGGGARGFAHLGVWRALGELGIEVDVITGTSIGAVVGAGLAQEPSFHEILPIARELADRLLDYTLPVVSLLKGERISRSLRRRFGGLDVRDLWLPFSCVSTNLTRSELRVHDRGDLATALRASSAIPGILPPVPFEGDLLVDGGVLDNLPIEPLQAQQVAGTVIAVDMWPLDGPRAKTDYGLWASGWKALRARPNARYPRLMVVLMQALITGSNRERRRLLGNGNDAVDCVLNLKLPGIGLLEFNRVDEVAARGYEAARPQLEAWLASRAQASS